MLGKIFTSLNWVLIRWVLVYLASLCVENSCVKPMKPAVLNIWWFYQIALIALAHENKEYKLNKVDEGL